MDVDDVNGTPCLLLSELAVRKTNRGVQDMKERELPERRTSAMKVVRMEPIWEARKLIDYGGDGRRKEGGMRCGEGEQRDRNAKIRKCRVARGREGEERVASTEKGEGWKW